MTQVSIQPNVAASPLTTPAARRARPDRSALAAISPTAWGVAAVLCLGMSLRVMFGQYDLMAIVWLTAALIAVVGAVRATARGANASRVERPFLVAGLLAQLVATLTQPELLPHGQSPAATPWVVGLIVLAAGAAAGGVLVSNRLRAAAVVVMLAAHLAAGATLLVTSNPPKVDVGIFQRDGADALLAGHSPYALDFPNPYPPNSGFYAPGVERDGRLLFGFPYPPVSLLLVVPAHLLGDYRFAGLLATTLTALLVASLGTTEASRRRAEAAAGLFLLAPTGFFVLWAGWTEPLVAMTFALLVWSATRTPRGVGLPPTSGRGTGSAARMQDMGETRTPRAATPWLVIASLAFFLATKQYTVILLPLAAMLVPGGTRLKALGAAVFLAALTALPFLIADPGGFVHSVALLQFAQPFRPDALSYLAPLTSVLPHTAAAAIPFAATALAIAWVLRTLPRTPAGFALAAGAVLLVFFACNKQAFCNYYHLVLATLCCAIAAWGTAERGGGEMPGGRGEGVTG
jgi:hypothetical protein